MTVVVGVLLIIAWYAAIKATGNEINVKLFRVATDGGKKSGVTGFFLVEIKSLFSIVILRFSDGSREDYHNHAFNAITWWLKGHVIEERIDFDNKVTKTEFGPSLKPKITKRNNCHRVVSQGVTYALTFRGPWAKTWWEFRPATQEYVKLAHGRREIARIPVRTLTNRVPRQAVPAGLGSGVTRRHSSEFPA